MRNESSDERIALELLPQFGLSKDEASLFVFLSRVSKTSTNPLKGTEISALSRKSRVRTYQILQRLVELGLVNVDFSRPKRYSTVSPQVALRRLLSVHESKLTELSHLESTTIESLLDLDPIRVELPNEKEESKTGSVVSLLHGLANIQLALRELMEGNELVAVTNEESLDHVLTVTRFLAIKPKSMRLVIARLKRTSPTRYSSTARENKIAVSWFRGEAPSFIAAKTQAAFLYYATQKTRAKPLSPLSLSSRVSQIAVINSERYAQQMHDIFELIWRNSENLIQAKKKRG